MKYLLTASILGLALVGCTDKNKTPDTVSTSETEVVATSDASTPVDQTVAANQEQVINFTGPNDLTLILKSSDNFETAQLVDNSDKVYNLKQAVAGSGVRLEGEDGVSIHFKNFNGVNEGTVELVKGKPIDIKEFVAEQAN